MSPGQITGFWKSANPCADCVDGWCQMNCGPVVPTPQEPSMTKTGGPAFPGAELPEHPNHPIGLTIRDWFAGQALAGMLAALPKDVPNLDTDHLARLAYDFADALLSAREAGDE